MRTFIINYGHPIKMSIVTSAEDGIAASEKAEKFIKSKGCGFVLKNIQVSVFEIYENNLTFI